MKTQQICLQAGEGDVGIFSTRCGKFINVLVGIDIYDVTTDPSEVTCVECKIELNRHHVNTRDQS